MYAADNDFIYTQAQRAQQGIGRGRSLEGRAGQNRAKQGRAGEGRGGRNLAGTRAFGHRQGSAAARK